MPPAPFSPSTCTILIESIDLDRVDIVHRLHRFCDDPIQIVDQLHADLHRDLFRREQLGRGVQGVLASCIDLIADACGFGGHTDGLGFGLGPYASLVGGAPRLFALRLSPVGRSDLLGLCSDRA